MILSGKEGGFCSSQVPRQAAMLGYSRPGASGDERLRLTWNGMFGAALYGAAACSQRIYVFKPSLLRA